MHLMAEPVFGVVLLNWNGYHDTTASLDSLLAAEPRPAYAVVVDNGSDDDSLAQLSHWSALRETPSETRTVTESGGFQAATWLRIIPAGANLGFAGGNNVGLAHLSRDTDATHFLLLNNDAFVAQDYFARVADALRAAPDTGILGCTIYHFPDTERVWFAGGYEDRLRGVALHREIVPLGESPIPTEWVTGCAMLISRALYDQIGGLAECYYPIYCEDSDYSLKARAAGRSVMIAPRAHVYHKLGATVGVGEVVPKVAYWQTRHRLFCIRRNYSPGQQVVAIGYMCIAKPARAAIHVFSGRAAMARAIMRGLFHGLRDDAA
jgi:GT2 family glycosyltransferase